MLPKLEHLSFKGCSFEEEPLLVRLFEPVWPRLSHLDLREIQLEEKSSDLFSNFLEKHGIEKLPQLRHFFTSWMYADWFPPSIRSFWSHNLPIKMFKAMMSLVHCGLPYVDDLRISVAQTDCNIQAVSPVISVDLEDVKAILRHLFVDLPALTQLSFHNVVRSQFDLYALSTVPKELQKTQGTVLMKLHKLDISHSSGISGKLSILLCHKFPTLHALILSDCGLNSEDLHNLAKANGKGRLPKLIHLDISQNTFGNDLKKLFEYRCQDDIEFKCQWESLLILNVNKNSVECFNDLSSRVKLGCLASLRELKILIDINRSYQNDAKWPSLEDLHLRSESGRANDKILFSIVEKLVKGNSFPSLQNIFVKRHWGDPENKENLLVQRYLSALTPDADDYWPDYIPILDNLYERRRDLKDLSHQTLREEIAREVTVLADSDEGKKYIAQRTEFIDAFNELIYWLYSNKLSIWSQLEDEEAQRERLHSMRHLFAKYNFYDSFTDPKDRGTTNT